MITTMIRVMITFEICGFSLLGLITTMITSEICGFLLLGLITTSASKSVGHNIFEVLT
jgi:hypothetical protein